VGCGYGYSSAVVARMAQAVVAVESDPDMAAEAQHLLAEVGADNVGLHNGPLAAGAPEHGPYDAIIIQGGVSELPDTLVSQLKEGGRIACLFVEGELGSVRIGHLHRGKLSWRFEFNAGAPVLEGFQQQQAFAL
jgi:protein-L-isoaspartate(D-aspartate) O-methyltransferase